MERDPFSQLTREVLDYQETHRGLKVLIGKISGIVYRYPRNYFGWDEDDVGDFFCMFFPKITGLIDRFAYAGKPFEAYLSASIRWQMKTFAGQRAVFHARQDVIRAECKNWYRNAEQSVEDTVIGEQERAYSPQVTAVLGIGRNGSISDPSFGRRFVYLVLRNAMLVDDTLIEHAAKLSGMDFNHLLGCTTELRQMIAKRKSRYLAMAARRDSLYARIQQLTIQLDRESERDRLRKCRRQIEFAREGHDKIVNLLKSVSFLPTHKDIGEVLGVPKGSIDSGLYYIRKEIQDLEQN
jgi:hypothetical protein